MDQNIAIFLFGLLLLVLFGWYFFTDSERVKRNLGTLLTVLLTSFCIWVAYPPFDRKDADGKLIGSPGKIHLGLDLQGGTSFLIRLDPPADDKGAKKDITKDMVEQAMEAIRKRVDSFGVSEPIITPQGTDRILVQIPGLDQEKINEAREQLRSKTINAMLYPLMLFLVCISIVFLLLTFVVPKIVVQFENQKAQLPFLTTALIAISDFVRHYGWIMAIVAFGAGYGFKRWLRDPTARRRYHAFLLRIPLVGRVVRGTNTARFARTFSTLTSSSVPVLEALRIAGEVVTNLPMRDAVESAAARVREGAPIGKSLGAPKIFPPMMIHLIASGETSGDLEQMLDRAATNQEREMDSILGAVVGLLGPLMIVVMAGFVLLIVLAMLLPIFQLNEIIG